MPARTRGHDTVRIRLLFNNSIGGFGSCLTPIFIRSRLLFASAALAAIAGGAALAGDPARSAARVVAPEEPRNVVVLIGDGMGAAQRAAIQYYHYGKHVRQPMDDLDHYGMLRTHAKGQGINTDSAAGATAMATGEKTKRNYVGVDANGRPLKTLLEIADERGQVDRDHLRQ